MSQIAIKIEGVSKEYRLGIIGHGMLYRDLQSWWARKRGKEDPNAKVGSQQRAGTIENDRFLALDDVSLEMKRGETVGIIGRNGAGKSTLLKILSRVTGPTRGVVRINGRVASLLEVGTGFHPELTGRENVFINGAVLGMNRDEIKRKFDEILDFSGVERFIDTPVKRYSSGMLVRLGFAVAAHLEPEILIVDEVLAVGDAEFQKKCMGKMGDVAREGRTVLFVSHNMTAIRSLCARTVLLDQGRIVVDDTSERAIGHYLSQATVEKAVVTRDEIEARMEGVILRNDPHIRAVEIGTFDGAGEPKRSFYSDEPIYVKVTFRCLRVVHDLRVIVVLTDEKDTPLLLSHQLDDPDLVTTFNRLDEGVYATSCEIPPNLLGGKTFFVSVHLECPKTEHLVIPKVLTFEVTSQGYNNVYLDYSCFFRPQLRWQAQKLNNIEDLDRVQ
jgi:lipopolysaccharide transport system ATP-binding protein